MSTRLKIKIKKLIKLKITFPSYNMILYLVRGCFETYLVRDIFLESFRGEMPKSKQETS
jgi:hypothetical protein